MKTLSVVLLAVLLFTLPAAAQDQYFEDILYLGDPVLPYVNCEMVHLLDHATMGVYLGCPSYPFISGLEFGLQITGRTNTALMPEFPVGPSADLMWNTDEPGFVDISLMFESPLTASDNVLLGTIDVFVLDDGVLNFTLTASSPSSLTDPAPLYVADPGQILVPLSRYPDVGPVDFTINGNCAIFPLNTPRKYACGALPNDRTSWGSVKSLYR